MTALDYGPELLTRLLREHGARVRVPMTRGTKQVDYTGTVIPSQFDKSPTSEWVVVRLDRFPDRPMEVRTCNLRPLEETP